MVAIRLSATIGEDRKLVLELPIEIPAGKVDVIILPTENQAVPAPNPAREAARAKLLAAGALRTSVDLSADAKPLTPEERLRIGTLPPGARPSEDLIDEDRGAW
jgi:hypothetical protein